MAAQSGEIYASHPRKQAKSVRYQIRLSFYCITNFTGIGIMPLQISSIVAIVIFGNGTKMIGRTGKISALSRTVGD